MSTELIRRCALTLGALLVWRLGTYIPLPGVDPMAWEIMYQTQSGGALGQPNVLSGGAPHRLGILSLSLTPYLTSAVFLQIVSMVSRALRRLADDAAGRGKLERATLAGTVLLAAFQSYGIAVGLEGLGTVVSEPGPLFRLMTVLTLTAGTLVLVWLAGQITARGIGNGIALILVAGIISMLPSELAGLLELSRQGAVAPGAVLEVVLAFAFLTLVVVLVERSRRRLPVVFAERPAGMQQQTADIALKLNPAGLMPVYLVLFGLTAVQTLLALAGVLANVFGWSNPVTFALSDPVRVLVSAVLIVFFTFLYTAFVCDPEQMAARLAACGGAIPGVAPGEETAAHLDGALSRTAALGAAYLLIVMLLPALLGRFLGLPMALGGISLLVLACALLDLKAEFRAYRAQPE